MAPRPLLFAALLGMPIWAQAQASTWTILPDPTRPPRYDTAYVHSHRKALSIGLVTTVQNATIALRDTLGNQLSYATNNPTQYGLGLSLGWLTVEGTITVPGLSVADSLKGATDSRNLGVGINGRRFVARALWNSSQGFHPEEPWLADTAWTAGQRFPSRGDIYSRTLLASLNYALSGKRRFSFKAALNQNERQQRSAGAVVVGGALWLNDIRSAEPFVPATVERFVDRVAFDHIQRSVLGLTIGYWHTLSIARKGFITGALVPGLSAQRQRIERSGGESRESEWQVGAVAEGKLGAGYNGDRLYAAVNGSLYLSSGGTPEGVDVITGFRFVRFTLGIRFKPPVSGLLARARLTP